MHDSLGKQFDCNIFFGMKLQIFSCRAEAFLKLCQLNDAELSLSNIPKFETYSVSCSQTNFFGMLSEAYLHYVRAQIEMSLGR